MNAAQALQYLNNGKTNLDVRTIEKRAETQNARFISELKK